MAKNIDKKLCLLIGIVVLLAGSLIWLALVFQLGKIREVSDNIQKEQLNSLVQQQRRQRILELGKELGDVENNQKEMNAFLIDRENAVPFLEMLENIAILTNNSIKISVVDLTKLKQNQTAAKPAAQDTDDETTDTSRKNATQAPQKTNTQSKKQDFSNQLGFSVELTGEYRTLVDFLTKLDNMPYFVRVYNFQVTLAPKKQSAQMGESAAAQTSQPEAGSKNLNTKLTIGIYTNGGK